MKSKTIKMIRQCNYCGLPKTYRSEDKLRIANELNEHIHDVCLKAKKT